MTGNDHPAANLMCAEPIELAFQFVDIRILAIVDEALRCQFPCKALGLYRLVDPARDAQCPAPEVHHARR